ncbi:uncharacterized protein ASCRUDRAFT_77248 [Ascoidea rubescens DSM 1968]|uniref:Uncharacterized protein n=1 Tax=Ascoidea rubescens DSM 1968 TaxID=1344418 RepID=A0A1D2VBT1_9ASCO|nr:hypothetical protein ASCRUDRAFT_77248 [Ascoidea rubescens DSM 1968]ODV59154.1 hypothetical protein ASCRUDRAFT_77248 [Ascoidea rubescens DSM 1968]
MLTNIKNKLSSKNHKNAKPNSKSSSKNIKQLQISSPYDFSVLTSHYSYNDVNNTLTVIPSTPTTEHFKYSTLLLSSHRIKFQSQLSSPYKYSEQDYDNEIDFDLINTPISQSTKSTTSTKTATNSISSYSTNASTITNGCSYHYNYNSINNCNNYNPYNNHQYNYNYSHIAESQKFTLPNNINNINSINNISNINLNSNNNSITSATSNTKIIIDKLQPNININPNPNLNLNSNSNLSVNNLNETDTNSIERIRTQDILYSNSIYDFYNDELEYDNKTINTSLTNEIDDNDCDFHYTYIDSNLSNNNLYDRIQSQLSLANTYYTTQRVALYKPKDSPRLVQHDSPKNFIAV